MISKRNLKAYDFNSIEDYFNYIVESRINGQLLQETNLIEALSKPQKKDFVNYCSDKNLSNPAWEKSKQKALDFM